MDSGDSLFKLLHFEYTLGGSWNHEHGFGELEDKDSEGIDSSGTCGTSRGLIDLNAP